MARTWLHAISYLRFRFDRAHLWQFVRRESVQYTVAWAAALIGAGICGIVAWIAVRDVRRADGNAGHVSVDFAGQWLLGRLLVRGEGRDLYERSHQRAVLVESCPVEDQDPEQDKSDAENIMTALMGSDDGPPPHVGGPLYPPIDAFAYAPLGALPPRIAYRLAQLASILLLFVAGGGIALLARGRIWWPVATVLLMLFPGVGGTVSLGQNASLSLAILTWGWLLVARGRPGWGGVIWGLLAYKPVWAAAFFLVPVLTRRWRMAGAMLATGIALAGLTLPFVGWQTWVNWLHVGREASETYDVDENWITMSRDLLSIPRRWLIDFELSYEERRRDGLAPALIGWAMLLLVFEATVRLTCLRGTRPGPVVGPGVSFVLLGAWATCFHFMYYDVLLAALAVVLLFTEPRRYLEPIYVGRHHSRETGNVCVLNRLAPTILVLLIVTQPLWAMRVGRIAPGDTVLLLILWAWCGWTWAREKPLAAG